MDGGEVEVGDVVVRVAVVVAVLCNSETRVNGTVHISL